MSNNLEFIKLAAQVEALNGQMAKLTQLIESQGSPIAIVELSPDFKNTLEQIRALLTDKKPKKT